MLPAYVIVFAVLLTAQCKGDNPVVRTTQGLLRGVRMRVLERDLDVFLGIPYAAPPVGNLRFRKPVPVESWEGTRNATAPAPTCIQVPASHPFLAVPKDSIQEDCLYLNVWAPRTNTSQAARAIMVWIYGGSFTSGSISMRVYDGRFLSAHGDVILVSVNYRLGALGFLYLGSPEVPGNMGLWDQSLALKWIRENAVNFGGDPERITMFGESAGAASVGLHMLSPESRDLFDRAILESGSALAPWAVIDPSVLIGRSLTLARIAGCSTVSMATAARCLQSVDAAILVNLTAAIALGPVVDKDFLPATPEVLFKEGRAKNTSLLIGNNRDEYSYFLQAMPDLFPMIPGLEINRSVLMETIRRIITWLYPFNLDLHRLLPAVLSQYEAAFLPRDRESYLSMIIRLGSDVMFNCPDTRTAAEQSSRARVFYYVYEHLNSVNAPLPGWLGVKHADEVQMVFGLPLDLSLHFPDSELRLSGHVVAYWSNFAKTGDPNTPGMQDWPLYDVTSERYISLAVNMTEKAGYRHRACVFWNDVFPLLLDGSRIPESNSTRGVTSSPCVNGQETLIACPALIFMFLVQIFVLVKSLS